MAELLACRRAADPVGGDTARQREVMAQSNVAAPASAQITPHAANAPLVDTVDAGAALREGGATTGGRPILDALPFSDIWAVDFEFGADPGENPEPVCLVAWELWPAVLGPNRVSRSLRLSTTRF
jgi:hypothetical protein